MNARGPIHAMLPILDSPQEAEAREAELDRRLNTYRAEVLAETTASEAEVRTDALKTFLYLLEQSAGPAVAEKLLKDTPDLTHLITQGERSAEASDFFQPRHTYARRHHAATIRFLVKYIDDSPDGTYRVAFGWRIEDGDVCWSPFDSDDFGGWVDVTGSTA